MNQSQINEFNTAWNQIENNQPLTKYPDLQRVINQHPAPRTYELTKHFHHQLQIQVFGFVINSYDNLVAAEKKSA